MPELQPGFADVVLEVRFDKLAPNTLRNAITIDCTTRIDQLVSPAVRESWIGRPYSSGSDPALLLDHVDKLLSQANPSLSASPTQKMDFYCWVGSVRQCYFPFGVKENGEFISISVEANGQQVECQLVAIMSILPEV